MTHAMTQPQSGLPDPEFAPDLYADTPVKRAIAWIIDVVVIGLVTGLFATFTIIGWFFVPLLYAVISFFYRWWSLASRSATPGMRLASVELRTRDGARFDTGTAFLHTVGYFVSVAVFPLQLISIALMLISGRKQGLTDHVLGSVAINRTAVG